jgi:hypothetical protein
MAPPHSVECVLKPMNEKKLPKGWNEAKIRRVLAHYEKQTEEDAVLEDEAGVGASETVMSVPAKRQR